jgi:exopolyphosphatase/guanosine-5'-triphosphate,3'-diphosphate pyrophosphatase
MMMASSLLLQMSIHIARLGEGVDKTKTINDNAIGRAQDILEKYRSIIEDNKVEKIRIVGTSSLRDAKNSPEVLAKLESMQ